MSDTQESTSSPSSSQPKPPPKSRKLSASEKRLSELLKQTEKAKARSEKLEALRVAEEARVKELENAVPRSTINQRKYLLGAMFLEDMETKPKLQEQVYARLDAWLIRTSDRAHFGFTPLSEEEQAERTKARGVKPGAKP